MSKVAHALSNVDNIIKQYNAFISKSASVEKEIEEYFLRKEDDIRNRVSLLDDLQRIISDERRCLEAQHQECRTQISLRRRHNIMLKNEARRVQNALNSSQSTLEHDEEVLERELRMLNDQIAIEDKLLSESLDTRDALQADAEALCIKEGHLQQKELEMEKALKELRSFETEIKQRKSSLNKKNETIVQWNETIERREKELTRCQDDLQDTLRALKYEERRLGVSRAGNNTVTYNISQRELMDDHDMCIVHERTREEIHVEDDDGGL